MLFSAAITLDQLGTHKNRVRTSFREQLEALLIGFGEFVEQAHKATGMLLDNGMFCILNHLIIHQRKVMYFKFMN